MIIVTDYFGQWKILVNQNKDKIQERHLSAFFGYSFLLLRLILDLGIGKFCLLTGLLPLNMK